MVGRWALSSDVRAVTVELSLGGPSSPMPQCIYEEQTHTQVHSKWQPGQDPMGLVPTGQ